MSKSHSSKRPDAGPVEASAPAAPLVEKCDCGFPHGTEGTIEEREPRAAAPDAELRELREKRDFGYAVSAMNAMDFGKMMSDLEARIAAREKELEGRTHAK